MNREALDDVRKEPWYALGGMIAGFGVYKGLKLSRYIPDIGIV